MNSQLTRAFERAWADYDGVTADWDPLVRKFLPEMQRLGKQGPKELPICVIQNGQLVTLLNTNNGTESNWLDYLKGLVEWSEINYDGFPDLAFSLEFVDVCRDAQADRCTFYPSRARESEALVWFDWDLVRHLNQEAALPEFDAGTLNHRSQDPIWRGTAQFERGLPLATREATIQYLEQLPRLHLLEFSKQHPELLDAALSGLKVNAQKQEHWQWPEITRRGWTDFDPIDPANYYNNYQNVLVVDGIGAAFRLADHLRQGQTVLFQHSRYWQHYFDSLLPWVHFIPLEQNLSDLAEKTKWILNNPQASIQIGLEGRRFYEALLAREASNEFSYRLLSQLATVQDDWDFSRLIDAVRSDQTR